MPTIAIYLVLALVYTVGTFGGGYLAGWESMVAQYSELAASVRVSNRLASDKLDALTRDRDKKQADLYRMVAEQEKLDAEAQSEIKRLAGELDGRPVRVRVVTESGECSASSEGSGTGSSEDRTGDAGTAYGVLPEKNTRRLRAALTSIETLNAAYRSCRSRLISIGLKL